jgi:hypothetical protein
MYHDKQSMAIRQTYGNPALLVVRMIWIRNRDREAIGENRGSLAEIDSMLSKVVSGFV